MSLEKILNEGNSAGGFLEAIADAEKTDSRKQSGCAIQATINKFMPDFASIRMNGAPELEIATQTVDEKMHCFNARKGWPEAALR